MQLPIKRKPGRQSQAQIDLYLELITELANEMQNLQKTVLDFQMSKRGWCYYWENLGILNKKDFDGAADNIDSMRLLGLLKPGFILEEEGHSVKSFASTPRSVEEYEEDRFNYWQEAKQEYEECADQYDEDEVDFWEDQDTFIQLLVEKSDLVSLFTGICKKYHIPIANLRGFGSTEQKAVMASNFKIMEDQGKRPILLTCGDFDPPGLGISQSLASWFHEYSVFTGWNPPDDNFVKRIGLNYKFIINNKLSWIDGLGTGSGKDLSDEDHICNQRNTYDIQGYIAKYGNRKCEANALVVVPELGRGLLTKAIDKYLGENAYSDYLEKINDRSNDVKSLVEKRLEAMDDE
jgi:hypothetical protein